MTLSTTELAAEGAVLGVPGCQFVSGGGLGLELAAEGAVLGVPGCQFGLRAGVVP